MNVGQEHLGRRLTSVTQRSSTDERTIVKRRGPSRLGTKAAGYRHLERINVIHHEFRGTVREVEELHYQNPVLRN